MRQPVENNRDILGKIKAISEKYQIQEGNIGLFLEGINDSKPVNYWDYLNLDVLLNLQKPKTNYPDEMIFVIYHQIVELYFKLIIFEITQLTDSQKHVTVIIEKITRIINYFNILVKIMEMIFEGIDKTQFNKFRMALIPASGYQSFQYRLIQILSTDLKNLSTNNLSKNKDFLSIYNNLYWKNYNDISLGNDRGITYKFFEEKYGDQLYQTAKIARTTNLWQVYMKVENDCEEKRLLADVYKKYDKILNLEWSMIHFRCAAKFLDRLGEGASTTGGFVEWKDFLNPKRQKIVFYPELWNEDDLKNWGNEINFRNNSFKKVDSICPNTNDNSKNHTS